MFKAIRHNWALARAQNLREEYADLMDHRTNLAVSAESDDRMEVIDGARDIFQQLSNEYGDLKALPDKQKKALAKQITAQARKTFQINIGRAFGYSFVAIWLESMALPGPDAERVTELSTQTLQHMEVF